MIPLSISESRTYIMLLARQSTGYQFVPFHLPENCTNDAATAANCFQRTYLENTPIKQAGLLVAVIPIEQFLLGLPITPLPVI